jgi:hypothetical protein
MLRIRFNGRRTPSHEAVEARGKRLYLIEIASFVGRSEHLPETGLPSYLKLHVLNLEIRSAAALMTNAIDSGVQWLAWGAVGIFLVVCVWRNWRTGFQRMRLEKIPFGGGMARIRQSLTSHDDAFLVAAQGYRSRCLDVHKPSSSSV